MEKDSFRQQMYQYFIPSVGRMLEAEKKHYKVLVDNKAPVGFINRSSGFIRYYELKLTEYKNYIK